MNELPEQDNAQNDQAVSGQVEPGVIRPLKTREGNIILPADCQTRESIYADTKCKTCIHAGDICKGIRRKGGIIDGYKVWAWCGGFEDIASAL